MLSLTAGGRRALKKTDALIQSREEWITVKNGLVLELWRCGSGPEHLQIASGMFISIFLHSFLVIKMSA